MKTVQIPSWNNPFVVTVNGVKHSFPGGATVNVPDEVAEAIENVLANMPKSFYDKDKEAFASKGYVDKAIDTLKGYVDEEIIGALYAEEEDLIISLTGGGTAASQGDGVLPPRPVIIAGGGE